jgi:drug/metabolite transporter (DMT)-like permease
MGQVGGQPENHRSKADVQSVENVLRLATQELETLHQGLITQMSQDIMRLRSEKSRLVEEVETLQSQQRQLQSQRFQALSEQQLAQQQIWAKQLAQTLAIHLQKQLATRLDQLAAASTSGNGSLNDAPLANRHSDNAYRLLASLDAALGNTFKSIQQELSSYHSLLSQQLSQMYSLEQQGEAILESLVSRLREQLQTEASRLQMEAQLTPPNLPQMGVGSMLATNGVATQPKLDRLSQPEPLPVIPPPAAEPDRSLPSAKPQPKGFSQIQLGLILVLLSSITLSFQNVVVRVILKENSILGLFTIGGFVKPSMSNSLLLLLMRMLMVAPLMFLLAPRLHPPIWLDLKQVLTVRKNRPLLLRVIGSGFFLFLSQFLIYLALGNISTGIATTIFFIYPAVTVLLSWRFFGDRPSFFLTLSIVTIYLGCFLAIPMGKANPMGNPTLGAAAAIVSGIAFAFYVILTQICAQKLKLHPIPFSFINFWTILFSSSVSLLFFPLNPAEPINWMGLWGGACMLAMTTLVGYLLNNYGIPLIGGAFASVVGASGPAFTVLLAWFIIGEQLQTKDQIIGVVLVTLWVAAIGIEKMRKTSQPSK